MQFPKRYLVTSYKYAEYVKEHYPTRHIEITPMCPNDYIYYLNGKGILHILDMTDKSIWHVFHFENSGFLEGRLKRLR